jgi:hypothetical protein
MALPAGGSIPMGGDCHYTIGHKIAHHLAARYAAA